MINPLFRNAQAAPTCGNLLARAGGLGNRITFSIATDVNGIAAFGDGLFGGGVHSPLLRLVARVCNKNIAYHREEVKR